MDYNFHIMSLPHGRTYLMNLTRNVVMGHHRENSASFMQRKKGKEFELHHLSDLLQDTLKAARRITRVEYVQF